MTTDHSAPDSAGRSAAGYDISPLGKDIIHQLAQRLTEDEARVLLQQGTERPFCGAFHDNKQVGVYVCKLCALPLFHSDTKFDSGTGWPSFFAPFDPDHVATHVDQSHGMVRTEIVCRRCQGHLGHVFPDGPPPTGHRYCLNSVSLEYRSLDNVPPPPGVVAQ
ncbi:MAG: peptide-methionine (R)-S-oxide reductase MsrB [Planctomycetota bacterium]